MKMSFHHPRPSLTAAHIAKPYQHHCHGTNAGYTLATTFVSNVIQAGIHTRHGTALAFVVWHYQPDLCNLIPSLAGRPIFDDVSATIQPSGTEVDDRYEYTRPMSCRTKPVKGLTYWLPTICLQNRSRQR
jgi:hypothetical protein